LSAAIPEHPQTLLNRSTKVYAVAPSPITAVNFTNIFKGYLSKMSNFQLSNNLSQTALLCEIATLSPDAGDDKRSFSTLFLMSLIKTKGFSGSHFKERW
jgi:hypothetical protein